MLESHVLGSHGATLCPPEDRELWNSNQKTTQFVVAKGYPCCNTALCGACVVITSSVLPTQRFSPFCAWCVYEREKDGEIETERERVNVHVNGRMQVREKTIARARERRKKREREKD